MKVAGLFAGIGGIELGLSRSGHRARLLCENDPAANAVLDDKFPPDEYPDLQRATDVRTLRRLPADVDLVAAGFPCQDLSQAGRTIGIAGARSGLVEHVFRLLEAERKQWVLLENVPFMLQLKRGRALDVIISTLEQLGYSWAYRVVNSRAFGLPQRRERVYLLASLDHDPRNVLLADNTDESFEEGSFPNVACGFYWTEGTRGLGWAVDSIPTLKSGSSVGIPSPPAIVFPDGFVGKPDIRDAERLQGFEPDWTRAAETVARRGQRWRLVGNAVTVDAAEWIGCRLLAPGDYDPSSDPLLEENSAWPRAAWNVGSGRHSSPVTSFPIRARSQSLERFLRFTPEALSQRAVTGFLARAEESSLRFPKGFLDALRAHRDTVAHHSAKAVI